MASLISNFECDIFISYRHKDNKYDGWVTEFVTNLKKELDATLKEDISIYFDTNPHDGLLETHNVDKSLEGKLKCLIFIPIISQTYCDTKSFAWQNELCVFNKLAKDDKFGRDIKLSNGNVASRILPVKIHDLDVEDKALLENELSGVLRAVEFIYKEAGVNRPLNPDDSPSENLNRTKYRNQINKVANAIKEIIAGLKNFDNSAFYAQRQESVTEATKWPGGKSIVVLPFEDMSPEKDQEYFCDGLSEELINALTKIKDVHVVARTSAFSFKGKEHDVRKIGKKLKVDSLLEGSIRKAGNKLRITTQLINVSDGFPVWSERYDREVSDVFAIQDEIALSIVDKLRIKLLGEERKGVLKRNTENVEALSFYLKGRYYGMMFSAESQAKALENYMAAVEKDPQYALAYCGLADLYSMMGIFSPIPPQETYLKAKAFVEKALSIDNGLGEAHQASAFVKMFFERNWNGAGIDFARALELSPGSAVVHINYAAYAMVIGKSDETIAAGRRAIALDPLSSTINQLFGFIYFGLGLFDESILQLRKALELNPGHTWAQAQVGFSYAFKGMYKEAMAECKKAEKLQTEFNPWFSTTIACVFAMAGKMDRAQKALKQMTNFSKNHYIDPTDFAVLHAWLGDREEAFKWLEKGLNEQSVHMYFLRNDSYLWLKPISSDPRFKTILEKMGLDEFVSNKEKTSDAPIRQEKSIIVLPFKNMSPNKENEYFSDGITEDIIAQLSKISALKVISRTSAMSYKRTDKRLTVIAVELGVSYALEGSVRKSGNQLRIVAQLIDARTDKHLWAETYNRNLADVFAIQTDVAVRIAGALQEQLTPEEHTRISKRPTKNLEAYNLYLVGRHNHYKGAPEYFMKASQCFEHAIELDPEFADAYAWLASTKYYNGAGYYGVRPHDVVPEVLSLLTKALDLDPMNAAAYQVRAEVRDWYNYEWEPAEADHRSALELDPSSSIAHIYYAFHQVARGRFDEALIERNRAHELDPASWFIRGQGVFVLRLARHFDEALAESRSLCELEPANFGCWFLRGIASSHLNLYDEALDSFSKSVQLADQLNFLHIMLAYGLAGVEKKDESRVVLNKVFTREKQEYVWPMGLALVYMRLGEIDRALDYIEQSYKDRVGWMLFIGFDSLFDPLRAHPRFQEIIKKIGPPEAIAHQQHMIRKNPTGY